MRKPQDIRILIYSQDGFGLGHLRRNLNISKQLQKLSPNSSVLIVADSPVAPFFDLPPRCDFVKIPTIVKVDTGTWSPNSLPVGYAEVLNMRSDIIETIILDFQPDIFLVDHMPHGALGELVGPLRVLRKTCPHTKVVLGLRDILGAKEVIRQQWQQEGAYVMAEEFYDCICVYGCKDIFDLASEYEFSSALLEKTYFQGYVSRQDSNDKRMVDVESGLIPSDNGRFVLLTGGGGHDASYFMDTFLDAVRFLQAEVPLKAMIATGPFMHNSQIQLLIQKSKGLPVVVEYAGDAVIELMQRADLVLSMGGYNTICELLHLRKNAIVIPRPGPSLEQTMRSRIMSDLGLFATMHPNQLTAENLAELIATRLKNGNDMNQGMLPPLDGASSSARRMLSAQAALENLSA